MQIQIVFPWRWWEYAKILSIDFKWIPIPEVKRDFFILPPKGDLNNIVTDNMKSFFSEDTIKAIKIQQKKTLNTN